VTVSVKVPDHYEPVAAIEAGKHVYCEWPLGRDTAEAGRMLDTAERRGIRHVVGLQGQVSPAINYVKDLIAEGYVGRVLSATMIGCAPIWGATIDRAFQANRANGANLLTITGGHQIDALCHCLGEFRELTAFRSASATGSRWKPRVRWSPRTRRTSLSLTALLATERSFHSRSAAA
jgi:predicted dehydrogenase